MKTGDWVEYRCCDKGHSGIMCQIDDIRDNKITVVSASELCDNYSSHSHYIRRCDHADNNALVSSTENTLIYGTIEWKKEHSVFIEGNLSLRMDDWDSIKVGDYFVFPVKPRDYYSSLSIPKKGVFHHYAPFAEVQISGNKTAKVTKDLRQKIKILVEDVS
ncbi:MAG: hypothetical protein IPG76_18460 [Acidobacteria bacterium]|nr:hypothetical protein [Acidobacteriota bacterium]